MCVALGVICVASDFVLNADKIHYSIQLLMLQNQGLNSIYLFRLTNFVKFSHSTHACIIRFHNLMSRV